MQDIINVSVILNLLLLAVNAGLIDLNGGHQNQEFDKYETNEYDGGHVDLTAEYNDHGDDGHEDDYHDPPKYSFNYAVHDPHTGDVKQHIEERDGHVVKGTYSLKEADGSTRIVEYHADKHNGFNAKVHNIPAEHGNGHGSYGF